MSEFGALWHGVSWGAAKIIGRKPPELDTHTIVPLTETDRWPSTLTLCGPPPRSWRPQVTQTADGVEVSFYVLSIVGSQTITRVTDTYSNAGYAFDTSWETIATGGGGIVW